MKLLILILLFFGAGRAFAKIPAKEEFRKNDKRNICSITINSDNEREVFKQTLPKDKFNFIELVPFEKNLKNWFPLACQMLRAQKQSCDVVLISGHFGGSFFGSSGYTLSLEELEDHACRRDCPEILSDPTEVFFLGCNSLATKEKDHRTPEQYLQALLHDGIPRVQAEQVVESRYGEIGSSNKDRMKRALASVPHLYGYDSVGPSGSQIEGAIRHYLHRIPNYAKHLEDSVQKRAFVLAVSSLNEVQKFNDKNFKPILHNGQWEQAMLSTSATQCSGLFPFEDDHQTAQEICSLSDKMISPEKRLEFAENFLKADNKLVFVPAIKRFFRENPASSFSGLNAERILERIQNQDETKQQFVKLLKDLKRSPALSFELTELMESLKWMSKDEARQNYKKIISSFFASTQFIDVDTICSLSITTPLSHILEKEDLKPDVYRNARALKALSCIAPKNEDVLKAVRASLQSPDKNVRIEAQKILTPEL